MDTNGHRWVRHAWNASKQPFPLQFFYLTKFNRRITGLMYPGLQMAYLSYLTPVPEIPLILLAVPPWP